MVNSSIASDPYSVYDQLNDQGRFSTAKTLAELDVESWIIHGKAQNSEFLSQEYDKYYNQFFRIKTQVDKLLFDIPNESARQSADNLSIAAKLHDFAEESKDERMSIYFWDLVEKALVKRYTVIIDHKLKKSGITGKDTLLSAAVRAGELDKNQWKVHHQRDYIRFNEYTVELLSILGVKSENVESCSFWLAEGCKYHDYYEENINDLSEQDTKDLWDKAFRCLCLHYYYFRIN